MVHTNRRPSWEIIAISDIIFDNYKSRGRGVLGKQIMVQLQVLSFNHNYYEHLVRVKSKKYNTNYVLIYYI